MGETVQSTIKQAASILHRDCLKPHGFRKTGLNWSTRGEWSHHISISLNRWNTAELAQLRFEAGIFIPEFHDIRESPPIKGTPKYYDCAPRSFVHHSPGLTWQEVTLTTSASSLANGWRPLIENVALPWLDELNSFAKVGNEFTQQNRFLDAAIAYALAGDRQAAAEAMKQSHQHLHPTALPLARRIAHKLKID